MSNRFETSDQKIIPAVLLYAFLDQDVLMIHRNTQINDFHEGKWNGLGGKLEPGETFEQTAAREFKEEAGIEAQPQDWHWLGQLYFPNFKPHKKEDWWVNVFVLDLSLESSKTIPIGVPKKEGTLHWVSIDKIMDLNLWEGDRHFLPFVLNRTPFQGTFFYQNGSCARHEIHEIQLIRSSQ